MKELFVTYELALLAKEKGFDEPCFVHYNPNGVFMWKILCCDEDDDYTLSIKNIMEHKADGYIEAPIHQQLLLWFRNKHNIKVDVRHAQTIGIYTYDIWTYPVPNTIGKWEKQMHIGSYSTYVEAIEKGLTEAFKLI